MSADRFNMTFHDVHNPGDWLHAEAIGLTGDLSPTLFLAIRENDGEPVGGRMTVMLNPRQALKLADLLREWAESSMGEADRRAEWTEGYPPEGDDE